MAHSSEKKAPIVYWPDAPMLNSPVLNAKPTDRPHIIRGAAWYSTLPSLSMLEKPVASIASCRPRRAGIQQDQQYKPSTRPTTMDKRLAKTPTTAGRCRSGCLFCLLMLSPPLAFWHRPYTGPVPRRWSFFGSNSPTISPLVNHEDAVRQVS